MFPVFQKALGLYFISWNMPKFEIRASMWAPAFGSGTPVLHTVCAQFLIGLLRSLRMLLEATHTTDNKSHRDRPAEQASCLSSSRCTGHTTNFSDTYNGDTGNKSCCPHESSALFQESEL